MIGFGWASKIPHPGYRSFAWLAMRATLAATIATALIFWGSPRYRDVNTPVLMILATLGLATVARRVRGDRASDPPAVTA